MHTISNGLQSAEMRLRYCSTLTASTDVLVFLLAYHEPFLV
jgi:hypothetical protein